MSIELGLSLGTDGSLLETGSATSRGKAGAAGSPPGGLSGFMALLAQFDAVPGAAATPVGGKDADLPPDTLADNASPANPADDSATLTLTDPASLIAQMQAALAGQDPASNPALALPVAQGGAALPGLPAATGTAAAARTGAVPGAASGASGAGLGATQDMSNVASLLAGGKGSGKPALPGTARAGTWPQAGSARVAGQAGHQAAGSQPAAGAATALAGAQGQGPTGGLPPGTAAAGTVATAGASDAALNPASATALTSQDGSLASALAAPGDAATAREGGDPASVQDVVARLSQNLTAARALQTATPADLAQAGARSQAQALGVGKADGDAPAQGVAKPGRTSGSGSDKHGATGVTLESVLRSDKSADGAGSAAGAGLPPTAVESFRQLVASAKGDKPAETAAGSTPVAAVTDRAPSLPSGVWDASAQAARAVSDSAAVLAAMPAAAYGTTEQQVADQVSMWVTQNVQSAELKLDALGKDPVEVSISLSGNEAQVQFRSDHAETRDLLTRAAADLDKSLQREGLVLSSVSVATSNQGQQDSARDPGQNAQAQTTVGRAWQRGGGGDPVAQGVSLTGTVRPTRGAVDLFV